MKYFRIYLWASGLAVLGATIWLAGGAWTQAQSIGAVHPVTAIALILGVAVAGMTAYTIPQYAALRWTPTNSAAAKPFLRIPAYYRGLALGAFISFLGVLAAPRARTEEWLAAHIFAVMLIHRALLSNPVRMQRLVEALTRVRALRVLDVALTNVMVVMILLELSLRAWMSIHGTSNWVPTDLDPLSCKLHAPIFGFAPNSLGYNDREFVQPKSPHTTRFAAVGDSFFVAQVPRPFGVIARTGELLAHGSKGQKCAEGRNFELYNFGIIGTGPGEYREILERDALRFAPDAVLLGIYAGNDIEQTRAISTPLNKRWYALFQYASALRDKAFADATAKAHEFFDLTQITRADREYWFSTEVPEVFSRPHYLDIELRHLKNCRAHESSKLKQEYADALHQIDEIKRICDAHGLPLLVVIQPDQVQISPALREELRRTYHLKLDDFDLTAPQRKLSEFCRARAIPCYDLLPDFLAAAEIYGPDNLYLRNDNHWSARGNEVAATSLASWLAATLR